MSVAYPRQSVQGLVRAGRALSTLAEMRNRGHVILAGMFNAWCMHAHTIMLDNGPPHVRILPGG